MQRHRNEAKAEGLQLGHPSLAHLRVAVARRLYLGRVHDKVPKYCDTSVLKIDTKMK